MYVVVTYDVNTQSIDGKRRLRQIAKECQNYGQRVQNSVFEVNTDYSTYIKLKNKILTIYDESKDSIRFYILGNSWNNCVEHFGVKEIINLESAIFV